MSRISSRKSPLQRLRVKQLALLAVVAGALLALPSSALATATPEINPVPEGKKSLASSGLITLTGIQGTGTCDGGLSGSSEWTNAGNNTSHSGTMNLVFKGCHWGTRYCTSAGQTKGTVVANSLKADLVWLDKAHTKAGVLLSPATELTPFAAMTCEGWGERNWTGSVIAEITSPKLGSSSTEWTLSFATKSSTTPTYTQVEEAGPEHRLYQFGSTFAFTGQTKILFGVISKLQGS